MAVIPHQYLDRTWPRTTSRHSRMHMSLEIPLTDGPVSLYPPEWSPFVLPLDQRHLALAFLNDFARGVGTW